MVVETKSQLPTLGLLRDCGDMGIIVGGRTILMERIGFGRGLRGVAVFLILLTLSPILANSKENTGLPDNSSYICLPCPQTNTEMLGLDLDGDSNTHSLQKCNDRIRDEPSEGECMDCVELRQIRALVCL